jgi:hypothetical protein
MIKTTTGSSVFLVCLLSVAVLGSSAFGKQRVKDCQILDQTPEAVYECDAGFVSGSDVQDFGKIEVMEVNADWAFYYCRTDVGDVDLNLRAKDTVFSDKLGGLLPREVAKIALDAGLAMRPEKGMAVQLRFQPGIYSDLSNLSGDSFSSPFSVSVIHTFDRSLSGMAGLEIRSGFDLPVIPLIGIVWAISDDWTLDLRCPRSKLAYSLAKDWNTYLAFEWENTTYSLGDHNNDLTIDYLKTCWGVTHRMPNEMLVRGEIGTELERSIRFGGDSSPISQVEVDRAVFLRAGIGAAF